MAQLVDDTASYLDRARRERARAEEERKRLAPLNQGLAGGSAVAPLAGTAAGAGIGAAVGSAVPGVGTALGASIGSGIGGAGGMGLAAILDMIRGGVNEERERKIATEQARRDAMMQLLGSM